MSIKKAKYIYTSGLINECNCNWNDCIYFCWIITTNTYLVAPCWIISFQLETMNLNILWQKGDLFLPFRINHYTCHYYLESLKYVHAQQEDTILVKTTVGLQGRAIKNQFIELISDDKKVKIKKCIDCLKNCSYRFCTLDSLITSMNGDCVNGLVFAGARVHEIKEILPVKSIINNIMSEYKACM